MLHSLSYSQDTTFVKVYYEPSINLSCSRVIANYESGFITCGERNTEALVINSDSLANIIWARTLSVPGFSEGFNDIIMTSTNEFVVSGFTFNNTTGNSVTCAKFDQAGDTIWVRSFRTSINNDVNELQTRIVETNDSSYLLTWANPDFNQTMLMKISKNGNVLWEKILGNIYLYSNSIKVLEDSTIYIAGTNYPNGGAVVKLNSTGNVLWAKNYANKNIIDMEYVNSSLYALYDDSNLGLLKMDTSGNVDWAKKYSIYSGFSTTTTPTMTVYNDSILSLQSYAFGWGDEAIKIDLNGDILANNTFNLFISDVAPHKYGGSFVLGTGPVYGIKQFEQSHIGIIQTDSMFLSTNCSNGSGMPTINSDNCITTAIFYTSGNGIYMDYPNFQLTVPPILDTNMCVEMFGGIEEIGKVNLKVYPNSTAGITHFEFSKFGEYEILISSIDGKIISKTQINGTAGDIDLSDMNSGVFIYCVVTSSEKISGRIIRE